MAIKKHPSSSSQTTASSSLPSKRRSRKKHVSSTSSSLLPNDDTPSKFKWIMKCKAAIESRNESSSSSSKLKATTTNKKKTNASDRPSSSQNKPFLKKHSTSEVTESHQNKEPRKTKTKENLNHSKMTTTMSKKKKKTKKPGSTRKEKEDPKADLKLDNVVFGDVVQAPPQLMISEKMATKKFKHPMTSMLGVTAKDRILKMERENMIQRYRELKKRREMERRMLSHQQKSESRVEWDG